MKLFKILILVIFTFGVVSNSYAVDKTSKKNSKTEIAAKKKNKDQKPLKKKKLGVDQSDFMPSAQSFGFILGIGASYNRLEQVESKTINHRLNLAGTYSFDNHWSTYVAGSIRYETFNGSVFRANDSDQFYNPSDINLGVVYSKMKPLSFVRRSSNTLDISIPTSERSRFDGYKTSISLTNFMQSYSWNKFSIFNRVFADYLVNEYKYSVTTDLINRDWLISNSIGVNYMYSSYLGIRASFRVNGVRYISRDWNVSFGNSISVFSNISGFQVFANFINNSYPENDRLNLNYYDQYRQIISGGITYAF